MESKTNKQKEQNKPWKLAASSLKTSTKLTDMEGRQVAKSVKCPTLDFSSGHGRGSSPLLMSSALDEKSA